MVPPTHLYFRASVGIELKKARGSEPPTGSACRASTAGASDVHLAAGDNKEMLGMDRTGPGTHGFSAGCHVDDDHLRYGEAVLLLLQPYKVQQPQSKKAKK